MPRILVLWVDALMQEKYRCKLDEDAADFFLDMRLTSKPPGELALKPELTMK